MTIPSWAKPGAKVVCVDAYSSIGETPLEMGAVYTIRSAFVHDDGEPTCELIGHSDWSYALWRFRPLVEPKTVAEDVAMFKRLIHDQEPVSA